MQTFKKANGLTKVVLSAAAVLCAGSVTSHAADLYSNGFETGDPGTRDFYDSTTNVQGLNIAIVPSGGGTLHLTAAGGANYAEVNNVDDTYEPPVSGESVYTDYGDSATGHGVVTSGPFYESTAVYIDTTWAAAPNSNNNYGFWLDTAPNTDPTDSDETNFRIVDTGNGTIGVQFAGFGTGTGGTFPAATITKSGWYTFKTTFEDSGGFVGNTLSVSDSTGTVIGSAFNDPANYGPSLPNGATGPLPWGDLTGTGYGDWVTDWSDGFANDTLGIDNVQVSTVPEPASIGLLGAGVLGLLRRRRISVK